jgi:iron(III) transport system substrate-binding protein
MKIFSVIAAVTLMVSSVAWGQTSPAKTLDVLAAYKGADREKILLEGAKAEGKIVWYTSLAGASYQAIVEAFERKYPQVKMEVYRAGSKDLAPKIFGEAQSGRQLADAIESTPGILMLLRDKNILQPYSSPELERYPESAMIKTDGDKIFWVNDRESFIGFGYNTKLVAESDVPKTYADLLKPMWKGKLAMQLNSTGDRVVGTMLKQNGPEYIKKFQNHSVKLVKVSGAALRDLIIAGEVTGSPTIFRNHVLVKVDAGAPVKWVPMEVVPTNAGGAALINNAPHPHAALLFIDFLIGSEGQETLQKFHYGAAWKDYPFKRVYPEAGMTTMEYQKAEKKWNKLLRVAGRR